MSNELAAQVTRVDRRAEIPISAKRCSRQACRRIIPLRRPTSV